ncbi:unnamed protein product [Amoebophrya sp. A25]|nr:unnamed protein product [Amoebophrya sp. A25]|eukprot:GSA25T00023903001.1
MNTKKLHLEWSHLCFEVNGRQVLQECYGRVYPGEVTALLGPSGAGKSTLMNLLAARQAWSGPGRKMSGVVRYGGKRVGFDELKSSVSYVMQNEALLSSQTVEETLRFAAALRTPLLSLPRDASSKGGGKKIKRDDLDHKEKDACCVGTSRDAHTDTTEGEEQAGLDTDVKELGDDDNHEEDAQDPEVVASNPRACALTKFSEANAEEVLQALGLQDVRHSQVGNLSGGQARRLSVGVELVTRPSLIFLDECTTGLDSFSTVKLLTHLREYAVQQNAIVVATLHQPSSEVFEHFDRVLVMRKGKVLFQGLNGHKARAYLEEWNVEKKKIHPPVRAAMEHPIKLSGAHLENVEQRPIEEVGGEFDATNEANSTTRDMRSRPVVPGGASSSTSGTPSRASSPSGANTSGAAVPSSVSPPHPSRLDVRDPESSASEGLHYRGGSSDDKNAYFATLNSSSQQIFATKPRTITEATLDFSPLMGYSSSRGARLSSSFQSNRSGERGGGEAGSSRMVLSGLGGYGARGQSESSTQGAAMLSGQVSSSSLLEATRNRSLSTSCSALLLNPEFDPKVCKMDQLVVPHFGSGLGGPSSPSPGSDEPASSSPGANYSDKNNLYSSSEQQQVVDDLMVAEAHDRPTSMQEYQIFQQGTTSSMNVLEVLHEAHTIVGFLNLVCRGLPEGMNVASWLLFIAQMMDDADCEVVHMSTARVYEIVEKPILERDPVSQLRLPLLPELCNEHERKMLQEWEQRQMGIMHRDKWEQRPSQHTTGDADHAGNTRQGSALAKNDAYTAEEDTFTTTQMTLTRSAINTRDINISSNNHLSSTTKDTTSTTNYSLLQGRTLLETIDEDGVSSLDSSEATPSVDLMLSRSEIKCNLNVGLVPNLLRQRHMQRVYLEEILPEHLLQDAKNGGKKAKLFATPPPSSGRNFSNFFCQFRILLKREMRHLWRSPHLLLARIFVPVVQISFYGIIFFGAGRQFYAGKKGGVYPGFEGCCGSGSSTSTDGRNRLSQQAQKQRQSLNSEGDWQGKMFEYFGAMGQPFYTLNTQSATQFIQNIPSEREIFLREYSAGLYSIPCYLLAKLIPELLVISLQAVLLLTIQWLFVGFPLTTDPAVAFGLLGLLIANSLAAGSVGQFIGCAAADRPEIAAYVQPIFFLTLSAALSGNFRPLPQIPWALRWAAYVFPTAFMTRSYDYMLFSNAEDNFWPGEVSPENLETFRKVRDIRFEKRQLSSQMLLQNFLGLLGIFLAYRILAGVVLWKNSRSIYA